MSEEEQSIDLREYTAVDRLTHDMRKAARSMNDREIRFLIDTYYQVQDERIRANNQTKALERQEEPNLLLNWLTDQRSILESELKKAIDIYSKNHMLGEWPRNITGVGPVIASGLLAFIDMDGAKSAGNIWRLADLDPSIQWLGREKAEKLVKQKKDEFGIKGNEINVEFVTEVCRVKGNWKQYQR